MNGWQQFIQIALPCLKFSPQIALSEDTEKLEKDLRIIEAGAKGKITQECKELSKKYFYYADWLMREKKLSMETDAIKYFFNYHNCTPSENLKSIGDHAKHCKTRVVKLVDREKLIVKDLANDETFTIELSFKPGSSILENLNKLDKLVLMSDNPQVHLLTKEKRQIVRNNLQRIMFRIGPWLDLDSEYYITHWGVLAYPLSEVEMREILGTPE